MHLTQIHTVFKWGDPAPSPTNSEKSQHNETGEVESTQESVFEPFSHRDSPPCWLLLALGSQWAKLKQQIWSNIKRDLSTSFQMAGKVSKDGRNFGFHDQWFEARLGAIYDVAGLPMLIFIIMKPKFPRTFMPNFNLVSTVVSDNQTAGAEWGAA